MKEAARVLRSGGRIAIFDKFLGEQISRISRLATSRLSTEPGPLSAEIQLGSCAHTRSRAPCSRRFLPRTRRQRCDGDTVHRVKANQTGISFNTS